MVADRDVLVAAVARGASHLEHARLPVRPRRVDVQVAADLLQLDERRGRSLERFLAQLRRDVGQPERREHAFLVRRVRERPERVDEGARAGRAHELGAEPFRLGGDCLHGNALDGHSERVAIVAGHDGDDLRQCRETIQDVGAAAHDREPVRDVLPASRIAGCGAAERVGNRLGQLARAVQQETPRGLWLAFALERGTELRLGLRPEAAHAAHPSLADRVAQLRCGSHAQRTPELDCTLRSEPEEAAEADQLRLDLAFELARVRDVAGLDELPQARLDSRPDPAELAHAAGAHELGHRSVERTDQVGRAAVRAHRVVPGAGEFEQRRVAFERVGDRNVLQHLRG